MKYILGIDVGGSKIASGLVDENFQIHDLKIVSTSQNDLPGQLVEVISEYKDYKAIGVAVPGPVVGGVVNKLPNISHVRNTNLAGFLNNKFSLPVIVENDAKSFAYFEAMHGSARGKKVVVGLVLGTGTGVGVVVDNQIFSGKDGLVGEYDHIITPEGKVLREYVKSGRPFAEATAAQDYLRSLISMIVLGYNPDVIVFTGGWSNLPGMEQLLNELAINIGGYQTSTPIRLSQFEYPGLLGAALLALNSKE